MKMCFDKRVLVGLGVAGVALLVLSPQTFEAALPLLVMAACPLSMVLMMRSMNGRDRSGDAPESTHITGAAVPDDANLDRESERRELEEEVHRLRAQLHLQSGQVENRSDGG